MGQYCGVWPKGGVEKRVQAVLDTCIPRFFKSSSLNSTLHTLVQKRAELKYRLVTRGWAVDSWNNGG